ncbi:thiamine pyrophosphate-requiring protein [Longimicrobium terrae]|uniref:Pyruvate dehydrogenase (Quinone) n=1 Tax=Longimicrobium terrae TaxID=1639882 RepID=A0A841H390_9BACT|nr:thiamine pyrophosphate-requiring protein [Longimicrobium terrae]MBB4638115.1 pyruvate dehydrogenase (quinone) [Longimicrobium terrae]MBB6072487.1 pyruvate dehydrogenase (quinone) [Longimicrobium terrae]NNC32102.1 thiamine pyrophosphate-requiring protein [Longimicrobium terrae]
MGEKKVSDFLIERLRAWGVRRMFGYSGDGINGILGALQRADESIEFIQPPHEELAALMASGYARFSGEVAVCMATSGPGAIHLLNGLYDAKLDHQPVVAIVGQQPTTGLGGGTQQEVDLVTLFKDVASAYVQMVSSPEQVRHVIDRAFRVAHARRTVTCVIIPHDVQDEPAVESPPHEHGHHHSSVGYSAPRVVPTDDDLRRAADVLNAGQKVAILVGAGALAAGEQVRDVAERLGAGVAKALLGKAVLPDDLPWVTGSVGWLGTSASNRMMRECDTLLMVGSGFPYTEFLPEEGQARGVQIDTDASMLGMRYPMEAALVGDAALTLAALAPLLERKEDRAWRKTVEGWKADWEQTLDERADAPANPLNPQAVVRSLSDRLPDGAIITADSGTAAVWMARNIRIREGMMASVSGTLATMGCAVPYAIAAKFAHPDRPVIALVGDGAMQMIGINALITAARYRDRWSDPRLIILVLNNRDLNFVTWEQRAMEGFPRFPATQDLSDLPYARIAEAMGLQGVRIDHPDQVDAAWEQALAANGPFVIDAVVDADVPTLPPELEPEQRKTIRKALDAGDEEAKGVREQMRAQGYDL